MDEIVKPTKQALSRARIAKNREKRQKKQSAENTRAYKKVFVETGMTSKSLKTGVFDGRTLVGKLFHGVVTELTAHIGGVPTAAQAKLIDQAARLEIITKLSWSKFLDDGNQLVIDGAPAPVLTALIQSQRELRSVLQLLGIDRASKIVTLTDIIAEHTEGQS